MWGLLAGVRRVRAAGLDARQHRGEGRAAEHEPARLRGHRQRQDAAGAGLLRCRLLRRRDRVRRQGRPRAGTSLAVSTSSLCFFAPSVTIPIRSVGVGPFSKKKRSAGVGSRAHTSEAWPILRCFQDATRAWNMKRRHGTVPVVAFIDRKVFPKKRANVH
jgi:hypothetical protein